MWASKAMYVWNTLLTLCSNDNQRVRQAFLIFVDTIFLALSVKAKFWSSVWTFMKILVRFGEFSKNFHVSFKIVSTSFMYVMLSPVSAQARANLWQIQWKFSITLLTLLNRAATPLCCPVITLAPSLTNEFRFLISKSHSFRTSKIYQWWPQHSHLGGHVCTWSTGILFQPHLLLG